LGQRAIAVQCDVSKADEVEKMVETVMDEFGNNNVYTRIRTRRTCDICIDYLLQLH